MNKAKRLFDRPSWILKIKSLKIEWLKKVKITKCYVCKSQSNIANYSLNAKLRIGACQDGLPRQGWWGKSRGLAHSTSPLPPPSTAKTHTLLSFCMTYGANENSNVNRTVIRHPKTLPQSAPDSTHFAIWKIDLSLLNYFRRVTTLPSASSISA